MGTIVAFDFRSPRPEQQKPKRTDVVSTMPDRALQALFQTVRSEDRSSDAVRRLNQEVASEMRRRGLDPLPSS